MKLIMYIHAGLLILLAGFYGNQQNGSPVSLYDTKWSLKKIFTGEAQQDIHTKAFIRFNEAQKSAGGNGSCNQFGSSFTLSGDSIRFSGILSTKMYCEDVQAIENTFFELLGQVNRFEIKGKTLLLYRDRDVLLEFRSE